MIAGAAPLSAQGATPLPNVIDSLTVLVPVRARAEVQSDVRRAEEGQAAAVMAINRAKSLRESAEARRKIMGAELDLIKDRLKLAKKEKREADTRRLESEQRAAKLGQKLLEERADLRKAEIEVAEAARDQSAAAVKAAQLELQLLDQREEQARVGNSVDAVTRGRQEHVLRDLELGVLLAWRDRAREEKDLADRSINLVERQLKLQKAQEKLVGQGN